MLANQKSQKGLLSVPVCCQHGTQMSMYQYTYATSPVSTVISRSTYIGYVRYCTNIHRINNGDRSAQSDVTQKI